MKSLVYIASGNMRSEYHDLPFDRIHLVDTCFRASRNIGRKITCLKMDALDSVDYLKENNIPVDCLVTLRESQGEGGFTYNLCSDQYIGYFMRILPDEFVWICNDVNYYTDQLQGGPGRPVYAKGKMRDLTNLNYVSLNLPYEMTELHEGDKGYLSPVIFTTLDPGRDCHVFKMSYRPVIESFKITEGITIRLIQDSIWRHEDELEHLFISFQPSYDPMRNFYTDKPKVTYYKQMQFLGMLKKAQSEHLSHIGFTPHYWYQYDRNYKNMLVDFIRGFNGAITIDFYYLNTGFHYEQIKKAIKTVTREKHYGK